MGSYFLKEKKHVGYEFLVVFSLFLLHTKLYSCKNDYEKKE